MKIKLLTGVLMVMLLAKGVFAQVAWLPLDENMSNYPVATNVTPNKYLLTAHAVPGIGFRQATLKLNKWNGQFWIAYPPLFVDEFVFLPENKMAVAMHNNEFYIAGSFNSVDKSKVGIIKWNGSAWQTVAGGIESNYIIHREISIKDMQSYNNELFVCGDFKRANGKPVNNFVVLQGGTWNNIETNKGTINSLQVLKDTLFVAGFYNQIDGKPTNNLAANYMGTWRTVNSPTTSEILELAELDTNLVAITKNEVFLRKNAVWQQLTNQWDYTIEYLGNLTEFEGKLYLAGTFKNNAGKLSHLLVWNGSKWEEIVNETDVLPSKERSFFINKRDNELIFSGNIKMIFGNEVSNAIRLFPNKTIVSGKVFIDLNKNCLLDQGEEPIENTILNVNDNYYTSTDANGFYSLVLDENKKSILKIFPGEDYEINCKSETIEITTLQNDSMMELNFPLMIKPMPHMPEYYINSASGFKARHGHLVSYTIKYRAPEEKYPLELKLDFDERLTFHGSDILTKSVSEKDISWIIQKDGIIHINFIVNHTKLEVGDSLHFNLSGRQISNENDVAKIIRLNQIVVSAFDPNEKQCDKEEMEVSENELNYHIQFQNLGNDSAVNINIVDTIHPSLPIQFIRIKEYSERHKQKVNYKVRDNAIIWSFKNIYLPSKSMSDDMLSSGYISFNSFLIPGLKPGDVIRNKAEIYFDYQDPVKTNRVSTKIIDQSDPFPKNNQGNLIIYPNPSLSGKISITYSPYLIQKVDVFDLAGKNLYSKRLTTASANTNIELNNLSQGIYIINITHSVGSVSTKFVIHN